MKTFLDFNLPKSLQKALDALGFVNPTPIQQKSYSVILSGRDMMGIAQTGTGKTFAYLVPILKQWKFENNESPKVVIIVPTRELVVQVVDEVNKLTQFMTVRTLGIYGGVNINTQKKAIAEGIDILIGTPGRMMDLALDGLLRFDNQQKLVIDEFDEILSLGFRTQLVALLSMMRKKRQNILFSATMTEEVDELLEDFFEFPEEVSLAPSGTPLEQIEQIKYIVPNFLTKLNLLTHILKNEVFKKVLLFVNNKRIVETVFNALEEHFEGEFGVIHSNKTQNYRLQTMAAFQDGELRGLVTTDIMARGLDISNVSHVINIQFAEQPEHYIHRIGRTGRAEQSGIAISLISPRDEEACIAAEVLMNTEIKTLEIPEEVEVDPRLLEFEKDKSQIKHIPNKKKTSTRGAAFHEKKDKNKKVNLGGPGKRNPKLSGSKNRNAAKQKAKKRK
jgi:ATP-dependent RNA helicase RhlE